MVPRDGLLHIVSVCRKDAENAMQMLNGTVIGKQTVRLSWGRSQGNKQVILCQLCHVNCMRVLQHLDIYP